MLQINFFFLALPETVGFDGARNYIYTKIILLGTPLKGQFHEIFASVFFVNHHLPSP
jgi:hypothetical protein